MMHVHLSSAAAAAESPDLMINETGDHPTNHVVMLNAAEN